mmetsp:Transcript_3206/g.6117  ORF Transcript_3206/g.6117 Transcript_3206/m.6117 type:complete len:266 (-) Transcript_3206:192-989(-)
MFRMKDSCRDRSRGCLVARLLLRVCHDSPIVTNMRRRLHPRKKWWLLRAICLCDSPAPTMFFMVTSCFIARKRCCVAIVTNPLIGYTRSGWGRVILNRRMVVKVMSVTMMRIHNHRTRWWRGHVSIGRWRCHHSSMMMGPRRRIRLGMMLVIMRDPHRSKRTTSTRESRRHTRRRRSKARGKAEAAYTLCPLVLFDPRSEAHSFLTGRGRKTCFGRYRDSIFHSRGCWFPRSNTPIFSMIRNITGLGLCSSCGRGCFFRLGLWTE